MAEFVLTEITVPDTVIVEVRYYDDDDRLVHVHKPGLRTGAAVNLWLLALREADHLVDDHAYLRAEISLNLGSTISVVLERES